MEVVTKIAPIALALIMLGLGFGLTLDDFKRLIIYPKVFFVGLICQILILPIVAYLLIIIYGLQPELSLGVMIIAAAPGGVTSNVLTKFANGDVALSISLTAVTSLICIITVPLIVFNFATLLSINNFVKDISIISISLKMVVVVTLPVIIGMLVRKFAKNFVIKNISIIEKITIILFLIVFFAIWIEEKENIFFYITQAGKIVLSLNITMMLLAFLIAKFFVQNIDQRKCIAIECGLQNGTLAVFVASQMFNETVFLIPTAAYALIMYLTAFIFVFFVKNIKS